MRVYAHARPIGVALSLVLTTGAYAQPGIPARLSLEDALRIAIERNPRLASARAGVDAADADRLTARARPNPAFTIESESYPLFESSRGSFINTQTLTMRVDQEIETAGRRRLRGEGARFAAAEADATRRDVERQLRLDVRRAYLQAALAKADLETARTTLSEIDRVLTLNRARLEQGEISGAEVRRLHAERLRFVDDVFASELGLKNATAALLTLLNAGDLGQAVEIIDPLRPGVLSQTAQTAQPAQTAQAGQMNLRDQALIMRPDVEAARQAEQRADTDTRLQRALRTPNITVGGGYQRNFGADSVIAGITVPLPIFNRNQGPIARADAERGIAQLQRSTIEANAAFEVQQAANAVETNRARVEMIEREFLDNAQQSVDIVRASYQLGAADLIDLLDAQRTWRETRRTYNRALYDFRISQFALDAAVGRDAVTVTP